MSELCLPIEELVESSALNPQISYEIQQLTHEVEKLPEVVKLIPGGSLVAKWVARAYTNSHEYEPTEFFPRPELLSADLDFSVILSCRDRKRIPFLGAGIDSLVEQTASHLGIELCAQIRPSKYFFNLHLGSIVPMLEYLVIPKRQKDKHLLMYQPQGDYRAGYIVPSAAAIPFLQEDSALQAQAQSLFAEAAKELQLSAEQKIFIEKQVRAAYIQARSISAKHFMEEQQLIEYEEIPEAHALDDVQREIYDRFNAVVVGFAVGISLFRQDAETR